MSKRCVGVPLNYHSVPHECIQGNAVILPHCDGGLKQKPYYAPIRSQCVNASVDKGKYTEFSISHNKIITFFFFHKSCPFESRLLFYNKSPKSMIKIFIESLKTAIMS